MVCHPSVIVITGASSGLGAALARHYAAPKRSIHLFGRDQDKLRIVADQIIGKGSTAHCHAVDVLNRDAMQATLHAIDQETPIDLLIANAGISAGTSGGNESNAQTRQIFDTNLTGVLNTVLPVLERMQNRQHGQIALMSSMASFRGLGSAPAYCASKAAVRTWGEALRSDAAKDNVHINVICPGFIRTPLTDCNTFSMPFLLEPEQAARIIQKGLSKNRGRIIFPWPMIPIAWLLRALPDGLLTALSRTLPRK